MLGVIYRRYSESYAYEKGVSKMRTADSDQIMLQRCFDDLEIASTRMILCLNVIQFPFNFRHFNRPAAAHCHSIVALGGRSPPLVEDACGKLVCLYEHRSERFDWRFGQLSTRRLSLARLSYALRMTAPARCLWEASCPRLASLGQ